MTTRNKGLSDVQRKVLGLLKARGPQTVAQVTEAVWDQQRLRIGYRRGRDHLVERTLDPLGLVLKAGTWYLSARSVSGARIDSAGVDGTVRTYRVDRIGLRRPISWSTGPTTDSNATGPYVRRMARSTPLPLASPTSSSRTR